jgi:hypothetical protein
MTLDILPASRAEIACLIEPALDGNAVLELALGDFCREPSDAQAIVVRTLGDDNGASATREDGRPRTDGAGRQALGICDRPYILCRGVILEERTEEIAASRRARELYLGEGFSL